MVARRQCAHRTSLLHPATHIRIDTETQVREEGQRRWTVYSPGRVSQRESVLPPEWTPRMAHPNTLPTCVRVRLVRFPLYISYEPGCYLVSAHLHGASRMRGPVRVHKGNDI